MLICPHWVGTAMQRLFCIGVALLVGGPAFALPAICQEDVDVAAALGDDVTDDTLDEFFANLKKERQKPRLPLLPVDRLRNGHVGNLPYAFDPKDPTPFVTTSVLQVLDKSSLLVNVKTYSLVRSVTQAKFGKPVVGPPRPEHDKTIVLLVRNIDTADTVDGQEIQLTGSWKIAGTDSYETLSGKRTIRVIEPTTIRLPK